MAATDRPRVTYAHPQTARVEALAALAATDRPRVTYARLLLPAVGGAAFFSRYRRPLSARTV